MTTKEKNAIIHKLPAEVFPEYFLIRVNEFNKVAATPLEEWIEYLKTGCIRSDTKVPGLEEGRMKRLEEDRIQVARNLKKLGVPIEVIIQSSGLSEKEIENL